MSLRIANIDHGANLKGAEKEQSCCSLGLSPCPGQALSARSSVDLLATFSSIALQRQSEIPKKVYRAWLLATLPAPHPSTHSRSGSLTPSSTGPRGGSCGIPSSSHFRPKTRIFPSCQEGCLLMPTAESHSGNCPQLAHPWGHYPPRGQRIAHEEVPATQRGHPSSPNFLTGVLPGAHPINLCLTVCFQGTQLRHKTSIMFL